MKLNYHKLNLLPLLFLLAFALITSCTVYQNVPETDGIYSSESNRTRIIVDNTKEYQERENQYFTRELERIDGINGTDILTNIEAYSSIEDTINNAPESIYSYNMNNAWGNEDSDQVVINLNLNNVGYGWNNYWNFYDPYYSFGYLNPWNRRAWRFGWRNRFGDPSFWPGYGYFQFPYYNPFFNGIYGYGYFNSRNYYGHGFMYNRYRNFNYGRRNYYNSGLSSRNYYNSRSVNNNNRRVTFSNRRSQNTSRNINVDNLANRLRIDKNKIKVYIQTKNVPVKSDELEAPEKTLMFVQVVHQKDLDTTRILQDLETIPMLQDLETIALQELGTIILQGVLHLEVVIFHEEAAHPLEEVLGVGVHHREALLKEVVKI